MSGRRRDDPTPRTLIRNVAAQMGGDREQQRPAAARGGAQQRMAGSPSVPESGQIGGVSRAGPATPAGLPADASAAASTAAAYATPEQQVVPPYVARRAPAEERSGRAGGEEEDETPRYLIRSVARSLGDPTAARAQRKRPRPEPQAAVPASEGGQAPPPPPLPRAGPVASRRAPGEEPTPRGAIRTFLAQAAAAGATAPQRASGEDRGQPARDPNVAPLRGEQNRAQRLAAASAASARTAVSRVQAGARTPRAVALGQQEGAATPFAAGVSPVAQEEGSGQRRPPLSASPASAATPGAASVSVDSVGGGAGPSPSFGQSFALEGVAGAAAHRGPALAAAPPGPSDAVASAVAVARDAAQRAAQSARGGGGDADLAVAPAARVTRVGRGGVGSALPPRAPGAPRGRRKGQRGRQRTTELPRNLTKQLFQAFAARKATKRAMELVCDSAGDYLERASEDLAAYARHARRSTIDESDVECLLKRHRVVTQNMALPQLLRQQLPRELLERVLPVQQPQ